MKLADRSVFLSWLGGAGGGGSLHCKKARGKDKQCGAPRASEQRGAGFWRGPYTYSLAPEPATLGQALFLGGLSPSCFSLLPGAPHLSSGKGSGEPSSQTVPVFPCSQEAGVTVQWVQWAAADQCVPAHGDGPDAQRPGTWGPRAPMTLLGPQSPASVDG